MNFIEVLKKMFSKKLVTEKQSVIVKEEQPPVVTFEATSSFVAPLEEFVTLKEEKVNEKPKIVKKRKTTKTETEKSSTKKK
jgi:hypothetical protein